MQSSAKKSKSPSDGAILWRLALLFKPHWQWIILGILLSLLTIIANVGLLALSGWFITSMALAGISGALINHFSPAAGIRAFAIMRSGGRYAERLISHEATFRILAELRHWFYLHLEPLAPAVLQKYHSGDILSRIRADIDTLENVYLRIIAPVITALLASLLFVYFISRYDYLLAVVEFILLLTAGLVIPLIINRFVRRPGEEIIETSANLRHHLIDSMHGMGELLIYGAAEQQAQKINDLSQKLQRQQSKIAHYNGISQATLGLVSNVALLLALIIIIPLVDKGSISPADLTMLALFMLASFEAIAPLPTAFQRLPGTIIAARRIFTIIDQKPMVTDPVTQSPQPEHFDIQFKQVTFYYKTITDQTEPAAREANVLQDLSFTLRTGSQLTIVGHSGTGKSSIINLLLRFHDADRGEILFGGYPITKYRGEDIRKYFSVVTQKSQVFNNTIKHNLLLANRNADDGQLIEVCRAAQIHDFIETLPEGYDTWVGEAGLTLSGGQLKRLTIARALLKNAPVLILDEPGEGLDRPTKKALLDAVFAYKKESSVLLITHQETGLNVVDIGKKDHRSLVAPPE